MSEESPKQHKIPPDTFQDGKHIFAIGTMKGSEPRWYSEVLRDARKWADKLHRPIEITAFQAGEWHHVDTAYPSEHSH